MHYTAVVTKEGKQTLAEFPGCPGCQTFADPGEDIAERAGEALAGWLEAHLASGQAPLEPKKLRWKGRGRTMEVPVPAKLAVKLAVRTPGRLAVSAPDWIKVLTVSGMTLKSWATYSTVRSSSGFGSFI